MSEFRIPAGLSAIAIALIYIAAFIYFGLFSAYPADGGPADKMAHLANHQLEITVVYLSIYVLFGILLAVLVASLHELLKHTNHALTLVSSIFGVVWVSLVIASGLIYQVGLDQSVRLLENGADEAFSQWQTVSVIGNSLGGGNEIVGGLWVLLVSLAALKASMFARWLNYFGCLVAAAGIGSVVPGIGLTEIFGVLQIVWFICLGVSILRENPAKISP